MNTAEENENTDDKHHEFENVNKNPWDEKPVESRGNSTDRSIEDDEEVKQDGNNGENTTNSKTRNSSSEISRTDGDQQTPRWNNGTGSRYGYVSPDNKNTQGMETSQKNYNLHTTKTTKHDNLIGTYPRSIRYSIVEDWYRGNYRNDIIPSNAGVLSSDGETLTSTSSSEAEIEIMKYGYYVRNAIPGDGDSDGSMDNDRSGTNHSFDKPMRGTRGSETGRDIGTYRPLSSESSISSDTLSSDTHNGDDQEWQGNANRGKINLKNIRGLLVDDDSNIRKISFEKHMKAGRGLETAKDGVVKYTLPSSISSDTLSTVTNGSEDQEKGSHVDKSEVKLKDAEGFWEIDKSKSNDTLDNYTTGLRVNKPAPDIDEYRSLSSESSVTSVTLGDTNGSDDQQGQVEVNTSKLSLGNTRGLLGDDDRYTTKRRFEKYIKAGGGCEIAKNRVVNHSPQSSEDNVGTNTLIDVTKTRKDQDGAKYDISKKKL